VTDAPLGRGAHAVALHAKPRYTKDIDVLVEPTRDNAQRLLEALGDSVSVRWDGGSRTS
jgi:hypothetical protein